MQYADGTDPLMGHALQQIHTLDMQNKIGTDPHEDHRVLYTNSKDAHVGYTGHREYRSTRGTWKTDSTDPHVEYTGHRHCRSTGGTCSLRTVQTHTWRILQRTCSTTDGTDPRVGHSVHRQYGCARVT